MEYTVQCWQLWPAAFLLTLLLLQSDAAPEALKSAPTTTAIISSNSNTNTRLLRTVKKDQAPVSILPATHELGVSHATAESSTDKVVVISENPQKQGTVVVPGKLPEEDVHIERSNNDFPDTYVAVFYILVGITSSALLLLIVRIYRLRLSRAERKYGVQGDRANQELTPLPMAIEDVNSDEEEDQTLFEVNRQNIRIL
ncbi:uncharacterized protein LOC6578286 [Drosophila mojavensis]|uniref:Uncharacterized protein n=1 Tax=Drosophila mojavensis TaxID=7230 RepID=B4KQ34_DROMO|nr:uncharacterized protein LOC6578286 [Drosophila mojavensis]EDW08136.1 uncharacterized protein Dmoj_GI19733 [Drosophila mojavensis]